MQGKGAIQDLPDARDYKIGVHVGMAGEQFDWEKGFDIEEKIGFKIKTKDQNGSFSCGGQAMGYYAAVLNYLHDKEYTEKSAKFLYAAVAVGNGGSGARDLAERFRTAGACDESLCPSYENGLPPSEAFMRDKVFTLEMVMNAKLDKASAYGFANLSIEEVAKTIRDNNGAMVGITGKDNGTWLSKFPQKPDKLDANCWNHWMYAGKAVMIDGKKYIGMKQSWGNVGEDGWQYFDESYFTMPGAIWCAMSVVIFPEVEPTFKFTKDLFFGITDDEVLELQKYLNKSGFIVSPTGAGSVGKETKYFGRLTQMALIRFQKANRISPAIGFFGPITRKFINK